MPTFDVEAFLRESLDHVWNGRLPGRLYECMAAAVAIHGPSGQELLGREEAVAEVVAWLAAFPDTRLTVEEVVWSGDEQRGFLASVRQVRASALGPAAGQPAICAGIAHFLVRDGLIREVWQEWDELGLAEQLGLDRSQTLARLAAERRATGAAPPFGQGEIRRSAGQLPPPALPAGHSPRRAAVELVLNGLHDIWNRRLVGRVDEVYATPVVWQVGSGQPGGRDDLAAHVLARLAAFWRHRAPGPGLDAAGHAHRAGRLRLAHRPARPPVGPQPPARHGRPDRGPMDRLWRAGAGDPACRPA